MSVSEKPKVWINAEDFRAPMQAFLDGHRDGFMQEHELTESIRSHAHGWMWLGAAEGYWRTANEFLTLARRSADGRLLVDAAYIDRLSCVPTWADYIAGLERVLSMLDKRSDAATVARRTYEAKWAERTAVAKSETGLGLVFIIVSAIIIAVGIAKGAGAL